MGRPTRFPSLAAIAALCTGLLTLVPVSPAEAAVTESPEVVAAFGDAPDVDVSFGGAPVDIAAVPGGDGYWLVNASGEVGAYAGAAHHGDTTDLGSPGAEVVDIAPSGSGGYWLLFDDGGIFAFGDAGFFGSLPGLIRDGRASGPVDAVALAATPSGEGYWVLDGNGGVFAFGDAGFFGSLPGLIRDGRASGPVDAVALAATPSGEGYWVLDGSGGVFAFGDAGFFGSLPGLIRDGRASGPVDAVALAATPSGEGYWILDGSGGVFALGDAEFHGSAADRPGQATGVAASGDGYWVSMAQGVAAPPLPANSGSGRRVVYCNSCQRVWLVEANGVIARSYQVSGRAGVPAPGNYSVFSKSRVSTDVSGTLRLDYMTRFAHGRTLAIGFHGLPINMNTGQPIQTLDELGQFRSAGCVRQAHADAAFLWDWAPVGTPVIVTP